MLICLSLFAVRSFASEASSGELYLIKPNDLIHVIVYQEDDLERKIRVAEDGTINLPLIGRIVVGGKTILEAATCIQTLLEKDFIVNPHVSILIEEYSKKRFSVLGQVKKPGSFEIPPGETIDVLQAIAMAGGYTKIANPNDVLVKRKVNSEFQVFKINAKDMAKTQMTNIFEIQPNDAITIGESIF
jgi:polysaccharide export outer membrane protein